LIATQQANAGRGGSSRNGETLAEVTTQRGARFELLELLNN